MAVRGKEKKVKEKEKQGKGWWGEKIKPERGREGRREKEKELSYKQNKQVFICFKFD